MTRMDKNNSYSFFRMVKTQLKFDNVVGAIYTLIFLEPYFAVL